MGRGEYFIEHNITEQYKWRPGGGMHIHKAALGDERGLLNYINGQSEWPQMTNESVLALIGK